MTTTAVDAKTPAAEPHGLSTVAPGAKVDTTDDQIKEMESEGQAQQPAPVDPAEVESPSAGGMQGAPGPKRTEFDKTMSDQDIDTAGTDADQD